MPDKIVNWCLFKLDVLDMMPNWIKQVHAGLLNVSVWTHIAFRPYLVYQLELALHLNYV